MSCAIRCLAFALIGLAATPSRAADSAYTTHDYARCQLVEKDDGAERRRCTGFGGIVVNYHGEDDDAVIDFGSDGSKEDWPYEQSFVFAGKTIEWRGDVRSGAIVPYAAIVRYDMGQSVSGPFRPELMIFRLGGTTSSCLAAAEDGRRADANARARRTADTFVRDFRCGKDKPRMMASGAR